MADKRPFAKIDTGYVTNPKWFQVERLIEVAMQNADQVAVQNSKRACMQAHFASILYCARNQTDGIFPVRAIKAELDLHGDGEEVAITALFDVGMWINHPGGMAEVRDYLEHQTPAEAIRHISNERSKAARKRWADERAAKANSKANSNANSTASSNANSNAEEKRREEKNNVAERADVTELLDHLDTAVTANGAKKPGRNKGNHDAMRLLIDKDKRSPEQIKAVIDWATTDSFWKSNILCARSLREKYDQLYIKAKDAHEARRSQQPVNHAYMNAPIV